MILHDLNTTILIQILERVIWRKKRGGRGGGGGGGGGEGGGEERAGENILHL